MSLTAEYLMMNELVEQVEWNCTILTAAKDCAQQPDETGEIDKAIENSKAVIARAKETLKSVAKYDNT